MGNTLIVLSASVVAATVLACAFVATLAFDRLVVIQRTNFEVQWRQDGTPRPMYMTGGLTWDQSLRTGLKSQGCWFVWACSTPPWVREHILARHYHRRFRLSLVVALLAVLVPLVGFLIQQWAFNNDARGRAEGPLAPSASEGQEPWIISKARGNDP